jgi:hypothetical protein
MKLLIISLLILISSCAELNYKKRLKIEKNKIYNDCILSNPDKSSECEIDAQIKTDKFDKMIKSLNKK